MQMMLSQMASTEHGLLIQSRGMCAHARRMLVELQEGFLH